jgi:ketosteroid isomerase-like protein
VTLAAARQFVEAVAAHDLDAAAALLDPDVETVTPRDTLRGIAACRQVLQKAIGDEQFAMEQAAEPQFEEIEGDVIARACEIARWRETGEVAYERDFALRLTIDDEKIVRVVVMPGGASQSQVVFDGRLHVHYGQAYVFSGSSEDTGEMGACFRGQTNGLLGAALPGELSLITGLHTGQVEFRVEVVADEPSHDETWEECVEAAFTPDGKVQLVDWDGSVVCEIPLEAQAYRVRYHGRGMDAAHEADTILEDESPVDQYLLSFWPAPAAPDRIVRQTSALADYWHRWAQGL